MRAPRDGLVVVVFAALAASTAASPGRADEPPPLANDWVDGPAAPASSSTTLPPAVAPREPPPPPDDTLVVPAAPAEDARVVVDDGLLPVVAPTIPVVTLVRSETAPTTALDLDTALALRPVPGLWVLPDDAGHARLSLRGQPAEDTVVVVDDDDRRNARRVRDSCIPSSEVDPSCSNRDSAVEHGLGIWNEEFGPSVLCLLWHSGRGGRGAARIPSAVCCLKGLVDLEPS